MLRTYESEGSYAHTLVACNADRIANINQIASANLAKSRVFEASPLGRY
jgi:hypothetical protein